MKLLLLCQINLVLVTMVLKSVPDLPIGWPLFWMAILLIIIIPAAFIGTYYQLLDIKQQHPKPTLPFLYRIGMLLSLLPAIASGFCYQAQWLKHEIKVRKYQKRHHINW